MKNFCSENNYWDIAELFSVSLTEVRYTFVNVITTPTHTHSYASEWSKDEKNHWHACTSTVGTCDTPRKDEAAHVYGDAGDARFTCTVCAYVDAAKKNEAEIADNAAAGAVDAMIKALPAASDVTENDRAAIEAARATYNALTDAQKAKISAETLQHLTDAEAALAEQPKKTDLSGAVVTAADQVYTGSAVTPALTVTCGEKALTAGVDYTAVYGNNVNIGTATVTITGIGDYTGTASGTFTILPKKVGSPKLKAGKNQLTVKWKADKSVTGYEIEYSLKKTFKKAKKITVKKAKTTSYVIKKLKAKKTYYVRIRSFKTVAGKKYYSEWSKMLSKKVK